MKEPPPLPRDAALFLDVDGTLLEIAPHPGLVRVPAGLPDLLARLSSELEGALALVSGRPLSDLERLFRPWFGAAAGLHGAERRRNDGSHATREQTPEEKAADAALDWMRPRLQLLAQRWPGVWLEDKGRTLALHYRDVPEREPEIRATFDRLMQRSSGWLRLIAGKMVVEIQSAMHGKGNAVAAFLAEPPFQGRRPVFLGDDTTDEDGFREVNRRGGLSIGVGNLSPGTAAKYGLPSVTAVHAWLSAAQEAAEQPQPGAVSITGG